MGYKIGIDVGGTFTDLVYTDGADSIGVVKTPTTPENQAIGVIAGIGKIAAREGMTARELLIKTDLIIHGTTVATNTMLEFNGAKTGLITTKGFRDDIEIRRGYKENIFNPRLPGPVPIARRRHRLTVNERIDREGKVLVPLDEAEAVQAARKLKEAGVESIGVCLFFGFLNSAHEKKMAEIIRREYPEAHVSLSHEVLPQIREFERVSTTLVNAYTSPKLKRYLESLERELKGFGFEREFFVMLSNGGIMNAAYAGDFSVYSLFSGPAGGVVACSQLIGDLCNEPNLITVDMGGTSYDISLIRNGKPTVTTNYWVSRYRVAAPMLDIHTIGAGGGSIAWVDAGGALHVGPQSAGAVPGPACYGKGGREPTVTDANVLLGFLDPDNFLGGEMKLDRNAAENAINEKVARPLGLDLVQAASGVFRIVNNSMANGIRVVSVQRGYDPRDFVLVAFGGNGALHAGMQARELGIRKVIVPGIATAFSARGLLSSNIVIDKMRTYIGRSSDYSLDKMNFLLSEMRKEIENNLPAARRTRSGFMGKALNNYFVDMHYKGETHEITVPLKSSGGDVAAEDIARAVQAFHSAHESLHTFSNPDEPVYFMNLRLEAIIQTSKPPVQKLESSGGDASAALRGERSVYFEDAGGFVKTPIYDGASIRCGNVVRGPCVIEEPATTIVVYPSQIAHLTEFDNYEITIR
ncbi:hydantoinase/oxoprolinase family protein [Candidatus Poribacteria bacterium]|nr:hydantoinase/oxoprolinase family protein [Candidatus Poribacteria bacterium]